MLRTRYQCLDVSGAVLYFERSMYYEDYNAKAQVDCLAWIRLVTEAEWENYQRLTFEDYKQAGIGGKDWQLGTKWLGGFSHDEIDRAEKTWGLRFPPDYRRFLAILFEHFDYIVDQWREFQERR